MLSGFADASCQILAKQLQAAGTGIPESELELTTERQTNLESREWVGLSATYPHRLKDI
jgi:hypothetical protein